MDDDLEDENTPVVLDESQTTAALAIETACGENQTKLADVLMKVFPDITPESQFDETNLLSVAAGTALPEGLRQALTTAATPDEGVKVREDVLDETIGSYVNGVVVLLRAPRIASRIANDTAKKVTATPEELKILGEFPLVVEEFDLLFKKDAFKTYAVEALTAPAAEGAPKKKSRATPDGAFKAAKTVVTGMAKAIKDVDFLDDIQGIAPGFGEEGDGKNEKWAEALKLHLKQAGGGGPAIGGSDVISNPRVKKPRLPDDAPEGE